MAQAKHQQIPRKFNQSVCIVNVAVCNMDTEIGVDVPQRPGPTAMKISSFNAALS